MFGIDFDTPTCFVALERTERVLFVLQLFVLQHISNMRFHEHTRYCFPVLCEIVCHHSFPTGAASEASRKMLKVASGNVRRKARRDAVHALNTLISDLGLPLPKMRKRVDMQALAKILRSDSQTLRFS